MEEGCGGDPQMPLFPRAVCCDEKAGCTVLTPRVTNLSSISFNLTTYVLSFTQIHLLLTKTSKSDRRRCEARTTLNKVLTRRAQHKRGLLLTARQHRHQASSRTAMLSRTLSLVIMAAVCCMAAQQALAVCLRCLSVHLLLRQACLFLLFWFSSSCVRGAVSTNCLAAELQLQRASGTWKTCVGEREREAQISST